MLESTRAPRVLDRARDDRSSRRSPLAAAAKRKRGRPKGRPRFELYDRTLD
jgi:hypothetical protein